MCESVKCERGTNGRCVSFVSLNHKFTQNCGFTSLISAYLCLKWHIPAYFSSKTCIRQKFCVPLHAAFVQATNKQIEKLWQGMDWFVCGPIAMTARLCRISSKNKNLDLI